MIDFYWLSMFGGVCIAPVISHSRRQAKKTVLPKKGFEERKAMSEHTITYQEVETNFSGFCLRLREGEGSQEVKEAVSLVAVVGVKGDVQRWNQMREQFCEFELPFA